MGAQDSKLKSIDEDNFENSKLFKKLDIIASKLILNTNFQTMKNLQNEEYCNKLTLFTSEIINKQLNPKEILFLKQKISNKSNNLVKSTNEDLIKDKIFFFDKNNINKIGEIDNEKRKLMCIGISKFYIDIARLYSSILNVINPVYIFKDEQGNINQLTFEDYKMKYGYGKQKINPIIVKKNLCLERLNSLILEELQKTNININDISNNIVSYSKDIDNFTINKDISQNKYDITSEHLQQLQKITEKSNIEINNTLQQQIIPQQIEKTQQQIQQDNIEIPQSYLSQQLNKSIDTNIIKTPNQEQEQQNKQILIEEPNISIQNGGSLSYKYNFSLSKLKNMLSNPNIPVIAKTKICNLNIKQDGSIKSLFDMEGIPNLKFLYYDIFDYNTGKYVGMSEDVKKEYIKDVHLLYKVFTGNQDVPNNINDFTDINLKDYKNMDECKKNKGPIYKTYVGSLNEKVFKDFANKLALMYNNIQLNYNLLEKILDELFVYKLVEKVNDKGQKYTTKDIIIHPELTIKKLRKLEIDTKNIIIKYYIQCEKDFLSAFEAFEILLQSKISENIKNRIKNVETEQSKVSII